MLQQAALLYKEIIFCQGFSCSTPDFYTVFLSVCRWAIGMNHPRATGPSLGDEDPFIYKKGPAFGMPGVLVDGMDVLKVGGARGMGRGGAGMSKLH